MPFKTKIDLSSNRQVKQSEKSFLQLSGATAFGVPFSALTTGPDLTISGVTSSYTPLTNSTFYGNDTTTTFSWVDPIMNLGNANLTPITPITSGITQNTYGLVPSGTTVIDGNIVNLNYSGVAFDVTAISFTNLGGGNYSGVVKTNQVLYIYAAALDYPYRNIWVDVDGFIRAKGLILGNYGIEQNGVKSISKTINTGPWNIHGTSSLSVAHGLGTSYTGVTSVSTTVTNDGNTTITDFLNHSGNIFELDYTNVVFTKGSTYYDNANYDNASINRGFITIKYNG
jgi:hypothetical protein